MRWTLLLLCVSAALAADPRLADIDTVAASAMKQLGVPGAALGVLHNGEIVLAKGYGVRDATAAGVVDAATVFATGSVTKSFTALGCASVVDEGKLAWDTPVREYLPWFRLWDPVASDQITVRDMLSHRSGLPRHDFIRFTVPLPRQEFLRRLRHFPPTRGFREAYQYNNLMFVAAGYTCAERAGMEWEELITSRIFAPLGMTRSSVRAAQMAKMANAARPHEKTAGQAKPVQLYDYQRFGIGPNGAVNSTVDDLLRYARFYLDQGRAGTRQILAPARLRELWTPVIGNGTGAYALGWTVDQYRGRYRVHHGGAITGFTAHIAFFPEEKLAIVALNNLGTALPHVLVDSVADRMLGLNPLDHLPPSRPAPAPAARPSNPPPPPLPLAFYAGAYSHPAFGRVTVAVEANSLTVRFPAETLTLRHYQYDQFENPLLAGKARFGLNNEGQTSALFLPLESGVPAFEFKRDGVKP
ncbi:MAG: serine hydrolase [Acidobacteria bacterium]|nr:serine hydrolase [Acidobacteriota bacterium]